MQMSWTHVACSITSPLAVRGDEKMPIATQPPTYTLRSPLSPAPAFHRAQQGDTCYSF